MKFLTLAAIAAATALTPSTAAAAQAGHSWQDPAAPTMHGRQDRFNHDRNNHGRFNRYPGYRNVRRGGFVPGYWLGPRYGVGNFGAYGFYAPPRGHRWVRYYDDALLVDGRGYVHDGRYQVEWDRYGERWGRDGRGIPVYVGEGDYRPGERDYEWAERLERGRDGYAYDRDYPYDAPYSGQGVYGQAYGYGFGGGYTITETTVTTEATAVPHTTYVDEVYHAPAPRRRYKARSARRSYKSKSCACR